MRTLTAAMLTEIGLTVTDPGFLVQILFDAYTVRFSSFGDVMWNGSPWINAKVNVAGLSWDENGMVKGGRLAVGNHDGAFGALVLQHDIADRPIQVWLAYGGALAPEDPVKIFDGVGDEADLTLREVGVTLAPAGSRALYSPRELYSPATGFNHLPPVDEEIAWNGEVFRLERSEF
jgi:hypothetical protein